MDAEIEGQDDRFDAAEPRRVLLVEDSSATQDLLTLVLESAGHVVDVAGSGAEASNALQAADYDVVLCDFHLPDITGLEVARRFLGTLGTRPRPAFVAITGDIRGLMSSRSDYEVFDRVVPKPIDIDTVRDLVELSEPPEAPVREAVRQDADHALDALGYALFFWPPRAGPAPAPGLDGIDAIVITDDRDIAQLWSRTGVPLLPVIDLSGRLGASCDIDASALSLEDTNRISTVVRQFEDRRASLHPDLARSEEPADRLLARMHVSGGRLAARLSSRHAGLAAWSTLADPDALPALLSQLQDRGLIATEFAERIHTCPDCRSARVIVREECGGCGSSNLAESSYLHHFRCAYQAPEEDFQSGADLVCPKCRRTLSHFGRDYDRPGALSRCRACSATTSEPAVAFLCTDCGTRTAAEAMPVIDIVSGALTDEGRAYLQAGHAFLGAGHATLRFGDFPLELTLALNRAARTYKQDGIGFTLVAISHEGLADMQMGQGSRHARDMRALWLETLGQALADKAIVTRGSANDFVLLPGVEETAAEAALSTARKRADLAVQGDLKTALRVFGPGDLSV
ncbi:response regulator [Jannaschia sp.]|nr:response regulator [Jannaschia sp.]